MVDWEETVWAIGPKWRTALWEDEVTRWTIISYSSSISYFNHPPATTIHSIATLRSEALCPYADTHIGAGTIFRLGEQKLVKNNQDNQIQSIALRNYVFLEKGIYAAYNGRIFENFCVKISKLHKKNWGAGCTSCSPNNLLPRFSRLCWHFMSMTLICVTATSFHTYCTHIVIEFFLFSSVTWVALAEGWGWGQPCPRPCSQLSPTGLQAPCS